LMGLSLINWTRALLRRPRVRRMRKSGMRRFAFFAAPMGFRGEVERSFLDIGGLFVQQSGLSCKQPSRGLHFMVIVRMKPQLATFNERHDSTKISLPATKRVKG
jgi:hypothetical protein